MRLRWSPEAADQLVLIVNYIRDQNPSAADAVADSILKRISNLLIFPEAGRIGRVGGTRELVLSPLPYIVVYRLRIDVVELVSILHGAQRWP